MPVKRYCFAVDAFMEQHDLHDPRKQSAATRLRWSALTHPGRFRQTNEDAFLALTVDHREVLRLGKTGESTLERGDLVFAVSDGMGGHNAGEFASRIAVEKITELFPRAFRMDAAGIRRGAPDLLEELFDRINEQILTMGRSYEECARMGATLSLCWFRPGWMHFCHIGDSRIYYFPRSGGIKQISTDHTHVAWMVRTGQINASQARFHPARNQLNQALGANNRTIDPQTGAVGFEPGDSFLICSDGITDGLSDNGLLHIYRDRPERLDGKNPAEALLQEAMSESGRDNLTAVVVEVLE